VKLSFGMTVRRCGGAHSAVLIWGFLCEGDPQRAQGQDCVMHPLDWNWTTFIALWEFTFRPWLLNSWHYMAGGAMRPKWGGGATRDKARIF